MKTKQEFMDTLSRRILITGANRGVGLALARNFLDRGWQVLATAHSQTTQELAKLQAAYPDRMAVFQVELGEPASLASLSVDLHGATNRLDVILNNAAVLGDIHKRAGDGLDYADIERVHRVNVLAPLMVADSCMDLLMAGTVRTVANISSEAGSIGSAGRDGWYAYCMSKAALNMQGVLMHNHLKTLGGRVILIHPGWVRTFMQGKLDEAADLSPEESAAGVSQRIVEYLDQTPLPEKPPYVDWLGRPLTW